MKEFKKIIEVLKNINKPVTVLLSTKWEKQGEIYVIVGMYAPKSVRGTVRKALEKADLFPHKIPSVEIVGSTSLLEETKQSYITIENINGGYKNY